MATLIIALFIIGFYLLCKDLNSPSDTDEEFNKMFEK